MPRRLLHALLTIGPAAVGAIMACVVVAASLVMCSSGGCSASVVREFVTRALAALGIGGAS